MMCGAAADACAGPGVAAVAGAVVQDAGTGGEFGVEQAPRTRPPINTPARPATKRRRPVGTRQKQRARENTALWLTGQVFGVQQAAPWFHYGLAASVSSWLGQHAVGSARQEARRGGRAPKALAGAPGRRTHAPPPPVTPSRSMSTRLSPNMRTQILTWIPATIRMRRCDLVTLMAVLVMSAGRAARASRRRAPTSAAAYPGPNNIST